MERQFTKGIWVKNHKNYIQINPADPLETETICSVYGNDEQSDSNADLIIDAGNTANKTGLFASEILEQRDKLLKHLIDSNKIIESILFFYEKEMTIVDKFGATAQVGQNKEAIKNVTK